MNESEVAWLLSKSRRAIRDAAILIEDASYEAAISRSYYSVFYSAKAALLSIDENCKSHKGLLSVFGIKLVQSNLIKKEQGKILQLLYNLRQQSDYSLLQIFSKNDADKAVEMAQEFLDEIERFFDS